MKKSRKSFYIIIGSMAVILIIIALRWLSPLTTVEKDVSKSHEYAEKNYGIALESKKADNDGVVNFGVIILNDKYTGEQVKYELISNDEASNRQVDNILIVRVEDKLYKRSFEGAVQARWYGAKGDGVTDDTKALQNLLNSGESKVLINPGTYLVRKNSALEGFPNSDQPCLLIKNKNGLTVDGNGATIIVNEHAQGVLEIQNSKNILIKNLNVKGPGKFPRLDKATGRGEKGIAHEGYNTVAFWGLAKNNSKNTEKESTGGFTAGFPTFSGQKGRTWGRWNGGFIGNIAYGILIHNGGDHITLNNCSASGFNYVGIGVGHNGDFSPKNLNYVYTKNVSFINCTVSNNYDAGFHSMAVDGLTITGCFSKNNGHNEATEDDLSVDPGYGYAARKSVRYSRNVIIEKSTFEGNKRKGIDVHSGSGIIIRDNQVSNSYVGGIYAASSSRLEKTKDIRIERNNISNVSFSKGALGAIYVGGDKRVSQSERNVNAIISGNIIDRYAWGGIRVINTGNVTVANNRIKNARIGKQENVASIFVLGAGKKEQEKSAKITIQGNEIMDYSGKLKNGIKLENTINSVIQNNHVDTKENVENSIMSVSGIGNDIGQNELLFQGKGKGRLKIN